MAAMAIPIPVTLSGFESSSPSPTGNWIGTAAADSDGDDDHHASPISFYLKSVEGMPLMEMTSVVRLHREKLAEAERRRELAERESLVVGVMQFFSMYERNHLTVLY
jgi:hypothetical protein